MQVESASEDAGSRERENMTFDPHKLAEQYAQAGKDWCDRRAAADVLLRTCKNMKAKIALRYMEENGGGVSKAELIADASDEYDQYCRKAIEAQKEENLASVRYEQIKTYIDMVRTVEASERFKSNLR